MQQTDIIQVLLSFIETSLALHVMMMRVKMVLKGFYAAQLTIDSYLPLHVWLITSVEFQFSTLQAS